jgi:hypothetical protein
MTKNEFERKLDEIAEILNGEAKQNTFTSAKQFENRVREVAQIVLGMVVDFNPHPQAFPDIALSQYGIEVKFTTDDSWRSVANSVLETNRIEAVKQVYIMFGKMGGKPAVRWGEYEKCVMHVRTSHVPRFEVEIGAPESLFENGRGI